VLWPFREERCIITPQYKSIKSNQSHLSTNQSNRKIKVGGQYMFRLSSEIKVKLVSQYVIQWSLIPLSAKTGTKLLTPIGLQAWKAPANWALPRIEPVSLVSSLSITTVLHQQLYLTDSLDCESSEFTINHYNIAPTTLPYWFTTVTFELVHN